VKSPRSLFIASLALALTASTVRAADEAPAFRFELHGFVVGSLYMQDQTFLSGQGSGLLNAAPAPANHLRRPAAVAGSANDVANYFFGGDVRQTRFILLMLGPEAMGAKPKAHIEFDLFGNPNSGALGYESPNVRLRQAYAELKWGNTTLDAGQHSAHLVLAQIPVTLAHITNPVTFGAGLLGWRSIGFRASHVIPFDGFKLEIAGEITHPKWNDVNAAPTTFGEIPGGTFPGNVRPGNTPSTISLAWASNLPQVLARVKLEGKSGDFSWMGWVAGSYEAVNLKGFGNSTNLTGAPVTPGVRLQDGSVKTWITSDVGTVGGKLEYLPVTLMFQGYLGRATAPLIGSTLQFGDIEDRGGWAQLGLYATKQISLWGIFGIDSVNQRELQNWGNPTGARLTEANTGLRKENQVYGGMLRFMDGGYALAVEWYQASTKYLLGNLANDDGTRTTAAQQLLVSGGYFF
jgi:hypothetical protein